MIYGHISAVIHAIWVLTLLITAPTPKGVMTMSDLVEVIRCKDCQYAYDMNCNGKEYDCWHFGGWDYFNDEPEGWVVEPDGFCAWAERRMTNE